MSKLGPPAVSIALLVAVVCCSTVAVASGEGAERDGRETADALDDSPLSLHQLLYSSVGAIRLEDLGLMAVIVLGTLWVSGWLGVVLAPVPSVLFLTTIALILAQIPAVKALHGAGVIGNYLVLIFLASNGAMSVIANIVEIGPPIVYYAAITVAVRGAPR